jgi:uncharacterized protein (TIGR02284 family)
MHRQSSSELNSETVAEIKDLVQSNIDSRDGLHLAADLAEDFRLKITFEQTALEHEQQADELARYIPWQGGAGRPEGSVAASVHRAWMNLKAKLTGNDGYMLLSEAEAAEDAIRDAYEIALAETREGAVHDTLARHHAAVQASHDRIKHLRDTWRRM